MIKVKSSDAFRSIAKGLDPRLCSVILFLEGKIKDVSITDAIEKKVSIDAGIYTKPAEITELINRSYPCAIYLEGSRRIVLEVTD